MAGPKPLLKCDKLVLGYGEAPVLEEVSFEIGKGTFTALVGPNGSGKTTFIRAVLGLLKPVSGTLEVDRGLRFAYVPQVEEMNLAWPLTVRDLVSLTGARTDEAAAAMDRAGVLELSERLLRDLSGGQRHRAVLAQAFAQEPDVLVLDEPTHGLDVVAERRFLDLVDGLRRERGCSILFVTHTLPVALNEATDILLFHGTRIVQTIPEALVRTKVLEDLYGIPFVLGQASGLRTALPERSRS